MSCFWASAGMCAICNVLVVLLLAAAGEMAAAYDDFADIPGKFCEGRRIPCCTSRQDDCKVPILGTMCYCDEFCVRSDNPDCCPDYRYVCRNQTRPTSPPPTYLDTECEHNGVRYRRGESLKINCNECKCERVCSSPFGTSCRMEMKCSTHVCLMDADLVTQVNLDRSATWKAANYSDFWGHTLDEGLGRRLGTRHSKRRAYTMRPITAIFDRERVRAKVNYDLRAEKPGLVSPPLNQGWCAADWVISTVQVATDRLTIMSKGKDRAFLSPQHLLSCNAKNQRGCDGGHITRAWKFVQKFGLVPEACYPWEGRLSNCSISKVKDKTRTTARCANGNDVMSLHRTGPAYRVSKDPEAIMNEIMTSGPVQATMKVTRDFFSYRSGVYQCSRFGRSPRNDTYHSVRIVGWGEQVYQGNLVKYWIVSNSWGTWWGESGYFRIRRGVNECEIESLVLGAWINPILPKKDPYMPMMDKTNDISNTISYGT